MKEIVTIDGKQFELITEYPLTEQQRQQTISDIRKQSGCSSCNKTQSLGNGIQTLASPCIDVIVQAPATITITNVTIVDAVCTTTCPNIICPTVACDSITRDIDVTFENSGDLPGSITPTLVVNDITATGTPPGTTIVPARVTPASANGAITARFSGVALGRGSNHICADFTSAP